MKFFELIRNIYISQALSNRNQIFKFKIAEELAYDAF